MPRDSRALILAEIRTFSAGVNPQGPILSWGLSRLSRAFPTRREAGFPTPTLLRFPRSTPRDPAPSTPGL